MGGVGHTYRDHAAALALVLDSDLSLGVGTEPGQRAVVTALAQLHDQAVGQDGSHGHELCYHEAG